MKRRLLFLSLAAALISGCGYSARRYSLQPHEKVIFNDEVRAGMFRAWSLNDLQNTGRVVQITRPTSINCE